MLRSLASRHVDLVPATSVSNGVLGQVQQRTETTGLAARLVVSITGDEICQKIRMNLGMILKDENSDIEVGM